MPPRPNDGHLPFSLMTSHVRSELADVSASAYPAGLVQPRHGHDAAYFTLVVEGAYDERIGREASDVRTGRVIFHPAGEEHAVSFRAPTTRVVRLLPTAEALEAATLLGLDFARALERPDRALPFLRRLLASTTRSRAESMLEVDAVTSELLAALADARATERPASRIARRVREAIDAEPGAAHRLASLARAGGCHPITLAREFRRATGTSVVTYLRRARLRLACELLRRREMPISMVAATCGFSDQAHLTRALRRATGFTPARVA